MNICLLPRIFELLNLALPIVLRIIPQHFPRLLDADQPLARIISVRRPLDVRENALGEFFGRDVERIVRVGDIENVLADEGFLHGEAESLGAIATVDVAEAAVR